MNNLEIFDPALCCSTGVCGPSIDTDLLRISSAINVLNKKGIKVVRHNLSQEPKVYAENQVVSQILRKEGVKALPITLVNGEIFKTGSYPSNNELSLWLGVNEIELSARKLKNPKTNSNTNSECC